MKKPSNNCDSLTTSTKVAIKTEGRKNETGNSKSTESVNSKFPDYDSQKEIGMFSSKKNNPIDIFWIFKNSPIMSRYGNAAGENWLFV